VHTPKERVGLSPAAARCCCHNHTHTPVCVAVAAAAAVGQAPLGRSAVGIVCLQVRAGASWVYVLYHIYPQYTHTNEQTDDPPVGIERDGVSVCVCVCLLYPRYNIDACTHALKLHTQVVSMQSSCTPCTDLLHAHARVYIILYVYGAPIIHHVGFCCCCSLLLPLGLMMLHPRAYVFYYVPAYYYSIILRRYSGSTSSSRQVVLVAAGGGGQCGVCAVVLYIYIYTHNIHMCRVWRGAWWAGQRAAAHQWWASYKVRVAQSFIVVMLQQQQQHGGKVRACLLHACLPAALVAASGRAGGGTARISTRPPLTAASQQDTPIHTHNTPCPAPNRAWRGAFEWWRCAPVVCPRHIISLCGRLSGCLKHCSKGSQMHTHTYTRTARVVWWWCESVQATRTKTMYRERERERIDRDRSIDRCLSVCLSV
jgi:hypothetical protein